MRHVDAHLLQESGIVVRFTHGKDRSALRNHPGNGGLNLARLPFIPLWPRESGAPGSAGTEFGASHQIRSYLAFAGHLFDRARGDRTDFPDIAYGDLSGAMFAAFAIASALFGRERSRRGTNIDVSMTDGLVSWMSTYLSPAMDDKAPFEILGEPAYGIFDVKGGRRITLNIALYFHQDNGTIRHDDRPGKSQAFSQYFEVHIVCCHETGPGLTSVGGGRVPAF
jgi:hypothetical protein